MKFWVVLTREDERYVRWDTGRAVPDDTRKFIYVEQTRDEIARWLAALAEAQQRGPYVVVRDNGSIKIIRSGKAWIVLVKADPSNAREVLAYQTSSKATAVPTDSNGRTYEEQSEDELQQYFALDSQRREERRPTDKIRWNQSTRQHSLEPDTRPVMKWTPTGDVFAEIRTGQIAFTIEKLTGPGGPTDTTYQQQDFPTEVDVVISRLLALDFTNGVANFVFTSDVSGPGNIISNRAMRVEYGGSWDGRLAFVEK